MSNPPAGSWLLRPTRREWAPLVGDYFAAKIANAFAWRLVRVPVLLGLAIVLNVMYVVLTARAGIAILVVAGVWVLLAIGMPIVWRSKLTAVGEEMTRALVAHGHRVSASPRLRSTDQYRMWMEEENLGPNAIRGISEAAVNNEDAKPEAEKSMQPAAPADNADPLSPLTSPTSSLTPISRRSNAGFVITMLGLGVLSIAVLALTSRFGASGWSLVLFLVALACLGVAFLGLVGWASSRWARAAVARGRSIGKAIWLVDVYEPSRPKAHLGVLEADEHGLSVTIKLGVVRAGWPDLTVTGIADRGPRRRVIVVEGTLWGRVGFQILQPNTVARADEESLEECASILKSFESQSHARRTGPE